MIFLISTTQRCGSTKLTRMVTEMCGSRNVYVNGLQMGFSLARPREPGAVESLADHLRTLPGVSVFKTHDVPSADFDAVCAALPDMRILTMQREFKDVVVSRYFYMRHHWPTQPALGPPPKWFAEYLVQIGDAPDGEALQMLVEARVIRSWAREWAAFESAFHTDRALRLRYEGLLDGSAHAELEAFTGLRVRGFKSFAAEQSAETLLTGREGNARFRRNGRTGQWREWFTSRQAEQLDAAVAEALEKAVTCSRR